MGLDKQQLPDWFNGETYEEGGAVNNPLTGDEIKLNNIELSMYDFIMGSQMIIEMMGDKTTPTHILYLQKSEEWFRKTNPEAYKTLLD